jgi:hypothetical protein
MAGILYQYGGIPLPFGAIDPDEPGVFALGSGTDLTTLGGHENLAMLLVATPFNPDLVITTPGPLPFGMVEGAEAYTFDVTGATETIYPAATHGGSSVPEDTPADTYIPSTLGGEVQSQQSLFSGANPLSAGEAGIGEIVIEDLDGELDYLLELGWDGAALELRRGVPSTMFSTWDTVARLTTSGLVGDQRQKRFRLRPLTWRLQSVELHGQRYDGSGGLNGDTALAGRSMPYCAGYVRNITPIMINGTLLILQASFTSIQTVTAVYDGRVALVFSADYPTYAALAAATVTAGHYATCLASGLIRLGSTPVYGLTCDVTGDGDTFSGLSGPLTRGRIIRRIATGLGSLRFTDEQMDYVSFERFESYQSAPCGWYWDGSTDISKYDAIMEVLAGVCGWMVVRPSGQLSIGQIEAPEDVAPSLVLSVPDGETESRIGEISIVDVLPPRRVTLIGYERNYTVMSRTQIAGSVTQADVTQYGQPSQFATAGDQVIANNYPTSPVVTLLANFRDEADAVTEALRQSRIFNVTRRRYAMPVAADALSDVVGQRAQINNVNRFGWGAQKALLMCGINAAGNSTEFHFWG